MRYKRSSSDAPVPAIVFYMSDGDVIAVAVTKFAVYVGGTEKMTAIAVGMNANFSQGRSAPDKNTAEQAKQNMVFSRFELGWFEE